LFACGSTQIRTQTYHVLHQGRAEYTLIHPGTAGGPARVERVIMGTDASRGEQRQLLVGTGVWKKSRVPAADLARGVRESTGCLITEVVVPGFAWEDHAYLTAAGLAALLAGHPDEPALAAELGASVKG
jgi:predicted cupin superfamily sugar epimerase